MKATMDTNTNTVLYLVVTIVVEAIFIWDATERSGAGLVVVAVLAILYPVLMAGAYRRTVQKQRLDH
jgi:hypothetical protein